MSAIVVYVTAANLKEARTLSQLLVRERLAACVTIVPRVESTYWWKGRIERSKEMLLILKTQSGKFPALVRRIRQVHSYTVPEILALPVLRGNPDYLEWLKAAVK